MPETISVLVADDSEQVRGSVRAMLELEEGFLVVGEAGDGRQAVDKAAALKPDVALVDINMPVLGGIAATQVITREHGVPVVIISVQGEAEYVRQAMKAGASDYLIKPFSCADLVQALRSAVAEANRREVAEPDAADGKAQIITLFGAKGGTGRTMLAANLAASLALKTRLRVAAVDLDLEWGQLASYYGVQPQATILDLCRVSDRLEARHLDKVMCKPPQVPVHILAAPPQPHLAAEVAGEARADRNRNYVAEILDLLQAQYDYVVVDTAVGFSETNLVALDRASRIFLTAVPEVPTLENTAKALSILVHRLEYPRNKVGLVLNLSTTGSVQIGDVEKALGHTIAAQIPEDRVLAGTSASAGQPFALKRTQSPLATAVAGLVNLVLRPDEVLPAVAPAVPARNGAMTVLRSLVGGVAAPRARAGNA